MMLLLLDKNECTHILIDSGNSSKIINWESYTAVGCINPNTDTDIMCFIINTLDIL